jgi:hypothetical protein
VKEKLCTLVQRARIATIKTDLLGTIENPSKRKGNGAIMSAAIMQRTDATPTTTPLSETPEGPQNKRLRKLLKRRNERSKQESKEKNRDAAEKPSP